MLETINGLTNKIGFWETLEILSRQNQMKLKDFYKELNKTSYYNAFIRVKHALKRANLIQIDNAKNIQLTITGLVLLDHLKHCELLVNPKSDIKLDFRWKMEKVNKNE